MRWVINKRLLLFVALVLFGVVSMAFGQNLSDQILSSSSKTAWSVGEALARILGYIGGGIMVILGLLFAAISGLKPNREGKLNIGGVGMGFIVATLGGVLLGVMTFVISEIQKGKQ